MDYPCGKFGDCSFSRFGSIMRTDTQTRRQTRMNAILPRLLSSWVNTHYTSGRTIKVRSNYFRAPPCCTKRNQPPPVINAVQIITDSANNRFLLRRSSSSPDRVAEPPHRHRRSRVRQPASGLRELRVARLPETVRRLATSVMAMLRCWWCLRSRELTAGPRPSCCEGQMVDSDDLGLFRWMRWRQLSP